MRPLLLLFALLLVATPAWSQPLPRTCPPSAIVLAEALRSRLPLMRGRSNCPEVPRRSAGAQGAASPALVSAPSARVVLDGGSLDPAFGTGGVAMFRIGSSEDSGKRVVELPDGRLRMVSLAQNTPFDEPALVLTQHASDGTLDPAFGLRIFRNPRPSSTFLEVFDAALLSNGQILVLGDADGYRNLFLARFDAQGNPDVTFGLGGTRLISKTQGALADYESGGDYSRLDAGGRIYLPVRQYINGEDRVGVGRILPNGVIDVDYGVEGVATMPIPLSSGYPMDLALAPQPDGSVYFLTGPNLDIGSSSTPPELLIGRIASTGRPDATFGQNGLVRLLPPVENVEEFNLLAIAARPTGGLMFSAYIRTADGGESLIMALDERGDPDAAFGTNGRVLIPPPANGGAEAFGLAVSVYPLSTGGAFVEGAASDGSSPASVAVWHVDALGISSPALLLPRTNFSYSFYDGHALSGGRFAVALSILEPQESDDVERYDANTDAHLEVITAAGERIGTGTSIDLARDSSGFQSVAIRPDGSLWVTEGNQRYGLTPQGSLINEPAVIVNRGAHGGLETPLGRLYVNRDDNRFGLAGFDRPALARGGERVDVRFGSSGDYAFPCDRCQGALVDPDGKIVLVGGESNGSEGRGVLLRGTLTMHKLPNESDSVALFLPDPAFGTNGVTYSSLSATALTTFTDVRRLGDGTYQATGLTTAFSGGDLSVVGSVFSSTGVENPALQQRLSSSVVKFVDVQPFGEGVRDQAYSIFQSNPPNVPRNYVWFPFGSERAFAGWPWPLTARSSSAPIPVTGSVLARDAEGRIYTAGGIADESGNPTPHLTLQRWAFHPWHGFYAPDSTFGIQSLVRVRFPGPSNAHHIAVRQDGRIVVAGTASDGATSHAVVAQFLATGPTSVAAENAVGGLRLDAPYPTPVQSRAQVRLALGQSGNARLALYDVLGREVRVLHEGTLAAGEHVIPLDAASLGSGLYLLRLDAEGQQRTRTVIVR